MLRFGSYFFELTLWIMPFSIIGYLVYEYALPRYKFDSYTVIPAFILILGALFYVFLKKARKEKKKSLFLFMINFIVKILLSSGLVLFAALADKSVAIRFAITYFVFYILLMIFETRCFLRLEHIKTPGDDTAV